MKPSHPHQGSSGSPLYDNNNIVYGILHNGQDDFCGFYSAVHAHKLLKQLPMFWSTYYLFFRCIFNVNLHRRFMWITIKRLFPWIEKHCKPKSVIRKCDNPCSKPVICWKWVICKVIFLMAVIRKVNSQKFCNQVVTKLTTKRNVLMTDLG